MLVLQLLLLTWWSGESNALQCSPLTIPLCNGLGYTTTTVPYTDQLAVHDKIAQLLEEADDGGCSNYLRPFLCFSLAPKCRKKFDYGIRPCEVTCNFMERQCKSVIARYLASQSSTCETGFLSKRPGIQCISASKIRALSKTTGARPPQKPKTTTVSTRPANTRKHPEIKISRGKLQMTSIPSTAIPGTTSPTTTSTPTPVTTTGTTTPPIITSTTSRTTTPATTTITTTLTTTTRTTTPTTTTSTTTPTTTTSTTTPATTTITTTRTTAPTINHSTNGALKAAATPTSPVWIGRLKNTNPYTTSTTALPVVASTKENYSNYSGPIFNPFYPPTFGKVEDPRKVTPTSATPSTTPVILTTTIDLNTTVEPWYRKVDLKWLVKQVNISLETASGKDIDYTKNWDLAGYSEYLDDIKGQTKRQPWYKQNYSTFMSNVDIETVEWKQIPINGTLADTPSSAEQRNIFSQLFDVSEEDNSSIPEDLE